MRVIGVFDVEVTLVLLREIVDWAMLPEPTSTEIDVAVAAGKESPDSRITLLDKRRGWTVPVLQLLATTEIELPEVAVEEEGVKTQLVAVPTLTKSAD